MRATVGTRTQLVEELIARYPEIPPEAVLKEDLLRTGIAFDKAALTDNRAVEVVGQRGLVEGDPGPQQVLLEHRLGGNLRIARDQLLDELRARADGCSHSWNLVQPGKGRRRAGDEQDGAWVEGAATDPHCRAVRRALDPLRRPRSRSRAARGERGGERAGAHEGAAAVHGDRSGTAGLRSRLRGRGTGAGERTGRLRRHQLPRRLAGKPRVRVRLPRVGVRRRLCGTLHPGRYGPGPTRDPDRREGRLVGGESGSSIRRDELPRHVGPGLSRRRPLRRAGQPPGRSARRGWLPDRFRAWRPNRARYRL